MEQTEAGQKLGKIPRDSRVSAGRIKEEVKPFVADFRQSSPFVREKSIVLAQIVRGGPEKPSGRRVYLGEGIWWRMTPTHDERLKAFLGTSPQSLPPHTLRENGGRG